MLDGLFEAVKKGRVHDTALSIVGVLRSFVKKDVCFGTLKDGKGYTLLDHAVQLSSPAIALLLLHPRMRFDLHRHGKHGLTPLAIAALRGNRNTAVALYRAGANPLRCAPYDGQSCTVVDLARKHGHPELARTLARWAWRVLADAELWRLCGEKRPIADRDDDRRVCLLTRALDGQRSVMARALLLAYEQGLGAGDSALERALFHGKRQRIAELLGQRLDDDDGYRNESCPALYGLRESVFLLPLPPRPPVVDPDADYHPGYLRPIDLPRHRPQPSQPPQQPAEDFQIRPYGGSPVQETSRIVRWYDDGAAAGYDKEDEGMSIVPRQQPQQQPRQQPQQTHDEVMRALMDSDFFDDFGPSSSSFGIRPFGGSPPRVTSRCIGFDEMGDADYSPDAAEPPSAPPLPPPPPEYTCPLSLDWLEDPVMAPSGHSYSRAWIERHLRSTSTDPMTRQPLKASQLYPNRALRDAVARARARG